MTTVDEKYNRYNAAMSFVAPQSEDEQRLEAAKPITAWSPGRTELAGAPDFQPPATATAVVKGDYRDRAAAFNLKVAAMSTVSAVGMMLVATAVTATPVMSLAALGWFGGGYLLTWLAAYSVDAFTSAEGTAFVHTLRAWKWLDREQAHRHYIETRERFPEDYR